MAGISCFGIEACEEFVGHRDADDHFGFSAFEQSDPEPSKRAAMSGQMTLHNQFEELQNCLPALHTNASKSECYHYPE